MTPLPPIAVLLCSLTLVASGCGEKESGIGAGQDKPKPAAKQPAAKKEGGGTKLSRAAAGRAKPRITPPGGAAPSRLGVKDLEKGTGAAVKAGDQIAVNYSGALYKNGKVFDNSFDKGQPFPFQLGTGSVIPGWDQGLVGARVGARRQLIIPAKLGYGAQGSPPAIGPNEALIFVIDVIAKQ